jgi:hypothetical protein
MAPAAAVLLLPLAPFGVAGIRVGEGELRQAGNRLATGLPVRWCRAMGGGGGAPAGEGAGARRSRGLRGTGAARGRGAMDCVVAWGSPGRARGGGGRGVGGRVKALVGEWAAWMLGCFHIYSVFWPVLIYISVSSVISGTRALEPN